MEGSTLSRYSNASGDLRKFIEILGEIDELKVIDGADWNCEIGAITEYLADHNGPAVLFDNIKDYPAGHRVIAAGIRRRFLESGLLDRLLGRD